MHVPQDVGGNYDPNSVAVFVEAEAFCAMGTLCQLRRPLLLLLLVVSKLQRGLVSLWLVVMIGIYVADLGHGHTCCALTHFCL